MINYLISISNAKLILIFEINQMEVKKIKRGDRLQVALLELNVGDSVKVPYKCYSENSIRATVTQLKKSRKDPIGYDINVRSNVAAIVTRTQ